MPESGYGQILLAVDFSPETEVVVARASALRTLFQARLSLVHVVEYMPMSYADDLVLPDEFDLERELLEIARGRMSKLAERLQLDAQAQYLEVGPTVGEIVRVAAELAADLIVLGSHGRHGFATLLGSTANGVLHHARCDVLAVRISR